MNKKIVALTLIIALGANLSGCSKNEVSENQAVVKEEEPVGTGENPTGVEDDRMGNADMRILSGQIVKITAGSQEITISMYDNPTANDLLAMLPLELTINDFPGWDEKVISLEEPLSMVGAPAGDEPLIPEFGYYQPGNWLAIYYGPIGYWNGKVPLGKLDASIEMLRDLPSRTTVTIEKIK